MELYILYLYKHSDDILLPPYHTTTHIKYTYEVTITYLLFITTIRGERKSGLSVPVLYTTVT